MSSYDFCNCPACKGDPTGEWVENSRFSADKPCDVCDGSGQRKIDSETIDMAMDAREWLDERVTDVFGDYCNAFGFHMAYGVESWSFNGSTLDIVQDISCRGCHDTASHSISSRYLYAERDDRLVMLAEDAKAAKSSRRKKERANKADRLHDIESEAAELRKELQARA
jgi:hypothetical protein